MTAPQESAQGHAVVVGGGLAGIGSAVRLADRGWQVTLLEARPRLGGATYSFDRDGVTVDTGQHVLLRCYDEYRALLARMRVADRVPVQQRLDIPVLRPGRPATHLRRARRAQAPLHLLPGLARYAPLTRRERLAAMAAAARLRAVDYDDPRADAETFGAWLRRHGQSGRAVTRLWGLVCVAALNIEPEDASLALAARVLRTGLLEEAAAGDIATPVVPLSALHDEPARRLLDRLGVRCRTGERVHAVDATGRGGYLVRTSAGEVAADGVVVAVPHRQAGRLVPEQAAPGRDRWAGLGSSPIVNVHVRYDRPVTPPAFSGFAAVLDSPVQWVFDRTSAAGVDGQYLVVSLSAADAYVGEPAARILDEQLAGLTGLFPAARQARVTDSFVTREPHATFRQRAGTAALRPAPATRWPGLTLAGAWTATGWPDTMEGAVRSGLAAADALGDVAAGAPVPAEAAAGPLDLPATEASR